MTDPGAPIPPQQVLSAAVSPPLNGVATSPAPAPTVAPTRPRNSPPPESKDGTREIVETVVFVIVLVLLLKSFVAEAFVIPTGSMAESLWGYQKVVDCPKCGYHFPVNCSDEVDPQEGGPPRVVKECTCPNCRLSIRFIDKDKTPSRLAGLPSSVIFVVPGATE